MRNAPWQLAVFLLFAIVFIVKINASSRSDDYYVAGVVEFQPSLVGSLNGMLEDNLNGYIDILNLDEASETDIIVFPEGTLYNIAKPSYVPDASENVVPCDTTGKYEDFLVRLSCAARDVRKYLVINLSEKENCPSSADDKRPCASNGLNTYNTNVVFDREGRVISRYRKVHIYLEAKNTTLEPEFATFETDFGVRFGHFICFDILFYTPAEELVRAYGVKDFIFTNWFYSELPFLTAVQMQQSWAWGNNVNLLSAGTSLPKFGSTGSGIYAGTQGDLASVMANNNGVRQLLVASVPKFGRKIIPANTNKKPLLVNPRSSATGAATGIKLMKDREIGQFNSELIDFTQQSTISKEICEDDICCSFNIETTANVSKDAASVFYKYRIGVFSGDRTYEKEEWSTLKICALYACTGNTAASCGEMFNESDSVEPNFTFTSIQISGDFVKSERLLISPNSVNTALYPLAAESVQWKFADNGASYTVKFSTSEQWDDLLTFGIYANYYDGV